MRALIDRILGWFGLTTSPAIPTARYERFIGGETQERVLRSDFDNVRPLRPRPTGLTAEIIEARREAGDAVRVSASIMSLDERRAKVARDRIKEHNDAAVAIRQKRIADALSVTGNMDARRAAMTPAESIRHAESLAALRARNDNIFDTLIVPSVVAAAVLLDDATPAISADAKAAPVVLDASDPGPIVATPEPITLGGNYDTHSTYDPGPSIAPDFGSFGGE